MTNTAWASRWRYAPAPLIVASAAALAIIPWDRWRLSVPDAARDAWGITEFAFDTPAWILMALLVAIPLMVRYDRTSLTVRSSACRRLQLAARLALMLSLGATLADPRVRSSRVATDDIVVVDVSDSMTTELRDQVRGYLTAFFKLRAERARGRGIGARLYAPPDTFTAIRVGESVTLDFSEDPAQLTTTPADERGEQSSISLALKTAGSLRRRQGDTRITILSDGRLTPAESARTLAEVQSLTREGVQVRVVPLETSARRNAGITGVTFPEVLRIGQRFESKVLIHASHEGSARLTVEALGEVTSPSPPLSISLQPGDNQVSIVTTASAGGPNAFTFRMQEITLDGGVDTIAEDDTWTEVTNVASRLQVLLISTAQRPAIVGSLERNDLDVTVAEPQAVPSTMEELAKYDLIVLHDVPANRLELSTQRAITSFVDHEGVGLLMIGGPRSYGPGGWQGTPIYDALPVRVVGEKREETPELALMLVIDKSGSMANENKLDLVKRAAQLSARALDPADQIGVIAFDSRPSVLVRLQAASARLRIRSDIRRVGAGGGTNVLPALREAFLQLRGSKAKIKHVIVLSDGQSPEAGVPTLVQQMYDANITVSGVGVGSGAGKTLLRRIAQVGAGRYYFSLDGSDVPSIFQRETRQVSKNMIREEGHVARVRTAAQVLRGLRFDAAPPLVGLTPLAPRPLSEVLLDTTQGEPLLVRGRYGLGRTYAFASDADPRWARAWLSWPGFSRFWSQIARDAARPGRNTYGDAVLRILPGSSSGTWRLILDVEDGDRYRDDLSCTADLIRPSAPDEPARSISLELVAPGRYAATLRDVPPIPTLIRATARTSDDTTSAVIASTTRSIPSLVNEEYRSTISGSREGWLRAMVGAGAVLDETAATPWPSDTRTSRVGRSIPWWRQLLGVIVLPLFLLDLALRRGCARRSVVAPSDDPPA